MGTANATFEVRDVFCISGRPQTFVSGKIRDGVVRIGMFANASSEGGAPFSARICGIEHVRVAGESGVLSLVLETPHEGDRQRWKSGCHSGNLLHIVNVANQSSEPTLASGTSPAGQEPRLP